MMSVMIMIYFSQKMSFS